MKLFFKYLKAMADEANKRRKEAKKERANSELDGKHNPKDWTY